MVRCRKVLWDWLRLRRFFHRMGVVRFPRLGYGYVMVDSSARMSRQLMNLYADFFFERSGMVQSKNDLVSYRGRLRIYRI